MNNVFYNKLDIIGEATEIEEILNAIKGGENELNEKLVFDFQKIIPMPEDIRNEYFQMLEEDKVTKIDYLDLEKMDRRYKAIGDYIEWCYDNWGCKLDPCNEEIVDESIVKFETVNGRAIPVLIQLSNFFPTTRFIYISESEVADNYMYLFQNGEMTEIFKFESFETVVQY